MTILVGYDAKGNPEFQSSSGAGSSEYERQNALKLDIVLQKRLTDLENLIKKNVPKSRSKCNIYWEFGALLRKIIIEEKSVSEKEVLLFWKNVRMRTPEIFMAKDRGPNRIHAYYCFRLAQYSKKMAMQREWSEWSELFDRKGINNEERFFQWDSKKLESDPNSANRKYIRIFTKILNILINGLETSDLLNDEIERMYEGAWQFAKVILEKNKNKEFIKENKKEILRKSSDLMDGKILPIEFARILS